MTKHNTAPGSDGSSRLRQWATPSYDQNGRAARSSEEEQRSYSYDDGSVCHPSKQIPSGFEARDKRDPNGLIIRHLIVSPPNRKPNWEGVSREERERWLAAYDRYDGLKNTFQEPK
jgi:hypothetical protein